MPTRHTHTDLPPLHTDRKGLARDEYDLSHLPKGITDALKSYERTAAPVFDNLTTSPDNINNISFNDRPNSPHADSGVFFGSVKDFQLELTCSRDIDVKVEGTGGSHHAEEAHADHSEQSQRRLSSWSRRTSFQAMRNGVGAVLRRTSGSSGKSSNSSVPSRSGTAERFVCESASLRTSSDHAFEPSIMEESMESDDDLITELKPPPTILGRLARREASESKTLRKTASAGSLSLSHRPESWDCQSGDRTDRPFHGFMGSEFIS
ncbi:uncharacterized protein RCC_09907 [Ramularia collo-cygni]|uniref:Uncharacterized protein n=1 Tax=Ramularia collo-cygni TaxID=112498 RepID=A0A2D3VB51_9PEZI|nr:uncharacterized protein RCC_09907 [Ramularia collo-cygni]CZT24190.1 uncharacterized protein RCC_09907 [Ramularia collo-cygni]